MTSSDKDKDYNPLAINILRLQQYNFKGPLKLKLEDVVLFEYLVLKFQLFGFKPFFHSSATIEAETGIKRRSIDAAIMKWQSVGVLSMTIDGFPKVKHFTVHYDVIVSEIDSIYQFVQKDKLYGEKYKLLVQWYKLLAQKAQQKILNKELKSNHNKNNNETIDIEGFAIKKTLLQSEIENAKQVLQKLQATFNSRREMVNEEKRKSEKREYAKTVLPKGKNIIYQCGQALRYKEYAELENAFVVIADQYLTDKLDHVRNLMSYFFSQKENGEFDVIDYYLNVFNRDYSREYRG